jgi:voltage-gated potassium channel
VSDTIFRWPAAGTVERAQRRVFQMLEGQASTAAAKAVSLALTALIAANILGVIVGTLPGVESRIGGELESFEAFSVSVFALEYLLRVWSCTTQDAFRGRGGRLRYALTPLALVDLAVIAPAFLPWEFFLDLRFARVLRLLRILRVFKVARYSKAIRLFLRVLESRRADLGLIALLLALMVVLASSSMYFAEHHAQPQVFSSIPASMWWSIETLTTVGYGDMYPVTPFGKLLGTVIALVGIGFFALPAGILATGFADEIQKERKKKRCCPHCGKDLPERGEEE